MGACLPLSVKSIESLLHMQNKPVDLLSESHATQVLIVEWWSLLAVILSPFSDSHIVRNLPYPKLFYFFLPVVVVLCCPQTGSTLKGKWRVSTFAYEVKDVNSDLEWLIWRDLRRILMPLRVNRAKCWYSDIKALRSALWPLTSLVDNK